MRYVAKAGLLLLVVSVPFAKPKLLVGELYVILPDFLFLIVAATLTAELIKRNARLRWHNGLAIIIAYFGAMLLSVLAAENPGSAAPKLASQIYLLSLPVLVDALIDDIDDLRRLFRAWLAGTAVSAGVGTAAVVLFAAGVDSSAIDFALHTFGTLPPGNYPRIESTFAYPAMLCNYLTVSLAVLIISLNRRWLGPLAGYSLLIVILVTAAFTITPGLGGIAALIGAWLFIALKNKARQLAVVCLAIGSVLAVAFVAVAVLAPAVHPTAPFLFRLPGIDFPFAPSVRLMAWIEACTTVFEYPLFGTGVGSNPIAVPYVAPSGDFYVLTDAHNVFLNVAMHSGLVGLATILFLIGFVVRQMQPWLFVGSNAIAFWLGFAWLNAFAYQGLTGSYEDARHLWLLLGLVFAARRLQFAERSA